MTNIIQIIKLSIRELLAKKTLYFLLFLLILIIAGLGSQLYTLTVEVSDQQAQLAQKAGVLSQMMQTWGRFTVFFAVVYAAASIYNEKKSRNIVGVLAKPVSRREYLLGRWLGVVTFFTVFILIGTGLALIFMYLWGIPVTFLMATGIIYKIGLIVVYSSIAFVLSLFIPSMLGGGIGVLLFLFRDTFEIMAESSIAWVKPLGYALFYGSPALVKDDLIGNGILDNMLDPSYELYWGIILENFAYAGLLFFAGILLYQNKDIILD